MQATEKQPLILTLRLDADSQEFFNVQRRLYFPPERNYLDAHLTLFHQLRDEPETFNYLENLHQNAFDLQVAGLINLGAGVAYKIESAELLTLRRKLSAHFSNVLIPQDKQGFRPHITIMNKVQPDTAKALLAELSESFAPFSIHATGLDVWVYLNGPWEHKATFPLFF